VLKWKKIKILTPTKCSKTRSQNEIVAEELERGFEEGQKAIKEQMKENVYAEAIGSTRI